MNFLRTLDPNRQKEKIEQHPCARIVTKEQAKSLLKPEREHGKSESSTVTIEFKKFRTPAAGQVAKVPVELRLLVRFYTLEEKSEIAKLSSTGKIEPEAGYDLVPYASQS